MYTHSLEVRQCILNTLTSDIRVALLFSSPSLSSLLLPLLVTFKAYNVNLSLIALVQLSHFDLSKNKVKKVQL